MRPFLLLGINKLSVGGQINCRIGARALKADRFGVFGREEATFYKIYVRHEFHPNTRI
jgi:hypothetical protein